MAEIAKTVTPSLASKLPCGAHRLPPLIAGEDIAAGDACYIKTSDKLAYRSTGAAATAPAKVLGFAMVPSKAGSPVSLYRNVEMAYGPATLTPGTPLFLSGTAAGGLADAASTGGTAPVAVVVGLAPNEGVPSAIIYCFPSTY